MYHYDLGRVKYLDFHGSLMFGLRRFRVRTNLNDIIRPLLDKVFVDIDHIIVQQQFTTSPKDFLVLCEVVWNKRIDDVQGTVSALIKELPGFEAVTVISSDRDRTLGFVKGQYNEMYTELFLHTTKEYLCFLDFPITLYKDHGVFDLIGPPKEVERLLEFMRGWGTELDIVAITDYHTRDRGLLTTLTAKQLKVLKFAYDRGFFDHPRKADARKLSNKVGMKHTTFLTHIRKAQKRMLDQLFGA